MAEEKLKIVISADNADAVASLNELSQQLKKFEQGVKNATNGADLLQFQKGLTETRAKMEVLNASLNPIAEKSKNFAQGTNQAANALQNLGRVAQDAPFGFIGIQNNLNPLLESFQRLKTETGSSMGALKALGSSLMGAGGLGLALSVASSAFLLFGDKLFDSGKKAKEAKKEIDDATSSIVKDAAQIQVLAAQYQRTNLSLDERKSIIKDLNNLSPEYFSKLKAESTNYAELKVALDAYTASLSNQIKAKVRGIELEKVLTEQLKKQDEQNKVIAVQQEFADKNKTGRQATGSSNLAKEISLLDKKGKFLEQEIAGLTKIKQLETGGAKESTRTEAVKAVNVKVDYRPKQELAVNEELRERLRLITAISDQLQKQAQKEKEKAFFNVGGIAPVKSQALADYDQEQLAKQQMILGIEQSRKSELDEINKKFLQQKSLVESVGNTFQSMIVNVANSKNPFETLTNAVKQLVIDLAAAAAKMFLIKALMSVINPAAGAAKGIGGLLGGIIGFGAHAEGGVTTGPSIGLIGEAGPEAILPLDRFKGFVDQAGRMGAMSVMGNGGGGGNSEFVLRGNDLVLAMQRSNYSLNLRRG